MKGGRDKASQVFELTGAEARLGCESSGARELGVGAIYLGKEGAGLSADGVAGWTVAIGEKH
ncbi:hypothetical protein [Paeniglutamicibacter cryotolerans]|uniref:Uncharacterized protein n=1 Tax=Paeniglutamicibacter cryotolerans TaxID=670079 RepID=A0A839QEU8_9MICC|nr:hypothetical protein [Paeniglutamicibacter cryotolerans]MBB2994669.1 hypothetical protein [Paeniglutamicibacter cryotolerans]